MSTGVAAIQMPESPPMMNIATNAIAFSIAVVSRMRLPHSVPSQLNTLIADGSAIMIVDTMNVMPSLGSMPDMNMWWPHTMKPRPAMAIIENAIGLYPKIGLRACTEMMSDAMPIAGTTMM